MDVNVNVVEKLFVDVRTAESSITPEAATLT
jgi:hypothetical protein